MSYTAKDIRNIALLGHGGDGKTMLAEDMLFLTHGSDRLGSIADGNTVEKQVDEKDLLRLLNRFVGALPKEKRIIFVARYWHMYSIEEIAQRRGLSESKVKSILFRVRNELKACLRKEGIVP